MLLIVGHVSLFTVSERDLLCASRCDTLVWKFSFFTLQRLLIAEM